MDYISEIRALAEEGLRRDPEYKIFGANHHHWKFGEPVDMQKIRDFERDLNVKLPEAFVRYLTELGNGGAGPYYGIYSLEKIRENSAYSETMHLPVMLDHSRTAEYWTDFAKRYEALEDQFDLLDEVQLQEYQHMQLSVMAGGIFINTPGCTMNSLLMCRGAAAGEVFMIDFDYLHMIREEPYCYGKFEDWMIKEMKKSLK